MSSLLVFLVCHTSACINLPPPSTAQVPVPLLDDAPYLTVLENWKQNVKVVSQLQTRVHAAAVLFTPEMQNAYQQRFKDIFGNTGVTNDDFDVSKLSVFLSLFTPEDELLVLDDPASWNFEVKYGDQPLKLFQLKRIYKKEFLKNFYPFVTPWSADYVLFFEYPSNAVSAAVPSQIALNLKGPAANVNFVWSQAKPQK